MPLDPDTHAAIITRQSDPGLRLLDAVDKYGSALEQFPTSEIAEWAFLMYPPVFEYAQADLSRRGELARGPKVEARIEHGRWLGECPFCSSAQVLSPLDARFLCAGANGCANAKVRGAFVPIVFPEDDARGAIETVLLERTDPRNRNWSPDESVADLKAENRENL